MTVLLIDGRNALFRHAHANRGLKTVTGMPTGAVYGMLLAACARRAEVRASRIEVCWEGRGPHWRHRLYPGYKQRRPDAARNDIIEAVVAQEPWAQEILTCCGVRQWRPLDGEGDDALATRARDLRSLQDVVIESSDNDLAQLVAPRGLPPTRKFWGAVSLWKDDHLWDAAEVERRLSVPPALVPDYKALVGDTSDCYPGCPGVGPKRVVELLGGGPVEELLSKASRGEIPGAVGRALVEHQGLVRTCRRLAVLNEEASLEEISPDPDPTSLAEMLLRLECHTLTSPHRLEAFGRLGG